MSYLFFENYGESKDRNGGLVVEKRSEWKMDEDDKSARKDSKERRTE